MQNRYKKPNMKTFLLLTCGTNACFHIAKVLKENYSDRIRIVGADINPRWMIPTSPFLDAYYRCPLTKDPQYYSTILDICRTERVDFLLPSFDADQKLFYKENTDLRNIGVVSFGISEKVLAIYDSKVATNHYLKSIGLPVPQMFSLEEIEGHKQYFVKPKDGVGSVGAKIMSGEDIIDYYDSNLIIQEICSEPEITLECFNYDGKVYSIARQRLASKSGVCTKTKVFSDKELTAIPQKFADSVQLPYIFNLQFMTNEAGEKVITDVNLRTAGGMSLSYAAGWDEVTSLAKIMLGEEDVVESVNKEVPEQYIVRAYTDIVTKKIQYKIGFDFDGTLLDSRRRHEILMQDILNERNILLSATGLVLYKADGYNNLQWLQSQGIDESLAKEINSDWIARIETIEYLNYDYLYSGIKEKLEELSINNSLYLVTARNNKANLFRQLQELGILQYFEDVCVVPSCKESTQLKANYLKEQGISTFWGDTEVDKRAADLAGCEFKMCLNGFRSLSFWNHYNE